MAEIKIGGQARCSDRDDGFEVRGVVIDPDPVPVLTHLVVEPAGRAGLGRLVPVALVDAGAAVVRLRCTVAEFGQLEPAEETLAEFGAGGGGPIVLRPAAASPPGETDFPVADGSTFLRVPETEVVDLVPERHPDEDEERLGEPVHATDGDIGRLSGLAIDPGSHTVTHVQVRLSRGHFLGHTEVAIPSGQVSGYRAGIHLSITRRQVQDLVHERADQRRD
jgi:hypothetical protein